MRPFLSLIAQAIVAGFVMILGASSFSFGQTRAFIGAEGFGALANGWRNPNSKILFVTNLNDNGEGSFRQAFEVETGPRYIIFQVGGYIPMRSNLANGKKNETTNVITYNSNAYVAGQTAPGDGITFKGEAVWPQYDGFSLYGQNDCLRYIRVAGHGAGVNTQMLWVGGPGNKIIDHCTFRWGTDDQIMLVGGPSAFITVQKCISGEPRYGRGKGATMGYNHGAVSMHHNFLSDAGQRSPLLGYGVASEFMNNLIYNWGGYTGLAANIHNLTQQTPYPAFDLINNYYVWGPNSGYGTAGWDNPDNGYEIRTDYPPGTLYLANNKALLPAANGGFVPAREKSENGGPFSRVTAKIANPTISVTLHDISTQAKADAWAADLLTDVGCTKPKRDAFDQFLMESYAQRRKAPPFGPTDDYEYDSPFTIANGGNPWPPMASGTPKNLQPSGMTQEFITRHGLQNTVESALSTSISQKRGKGEAYQNIEWCLMEQAGDIPGGPVSVGPRPNSTGKSLGASKVKQCPLDIFGRTLNEAKLAAKKQTLASKIMERKLSQTK